jgi:hypothetical protein
MVSNLGRLPALEQVLVLLAGLGLHDGGAQDVVGGKNERRDKNDTRGQEESAQGSQRDKDGCSGEPCCHFSNF